MFLLACFVAFAVGLGCDDEPDVPLLGDPGEAATWATQTQFGDAFSEERVLASGRADNGVEFSVTVGDVALCLHRWPTLAVHGCTERLLDTHLASALATDIDHDQRQVVLAERHGLASVILRERVERDLSLVPSDELVDAFVASPLGQLYVSRPELRRFSHLLIQGEPEARAGLSATLAGDLDWIGLSDRQGLEALRRRYSGVATEQGMSLRTELGLLTQPFDENGGWVPVMFVVRPFADAVYALSGPGAAVGPVETDYGTHFILLEDVYPAAALPPDQARELARRELWQRAKAEAFARWASELINEADVRMYYQNLNLLSSDRDAMFRARSEELREALTGDP